MLRLKDENGVYGFHFSMTLRSDTNKSAPNRSTAILYSFESNRDVSKSN